MASRKAPAAGRAALYRMVFEESRDSMLVLELPEGGEPVVLDANPAALALHGFTRRQLIGKPVGVLGASLGGRGFRPAGGNGPFEVRHARPGGAPLVTEVTARTVKAGGRCLGILIERDVTWRSRLEEENREFSARLMREREAEKKRLAAGLHDSLGAMQVALSAELLLLGDSVRRGCRRKALAGVERARRLLKESAAGLKRSCAEAWPQSLAVSGLGAALEELIDTFAARSGVAVERDLRLGRACDSASCPQSIVIYRIAQEALANAERHSGSRRLDFSAQREDKWFTLEVRDYGRGFSQGPGCAAPDSLGLKIMADAASTVGGYFSVYSEPGKGTRVKARLPHCGRKVN